MSVYKSTKSPFLQFDFQIGGHRFHGSTKCTTRKDAEKFEAIELERAKALVKAMKRSRASLQIDDVAERLWADRGQYDADSKATETNFARLIEYFGKAKSLTEIDHKAAKELVAWRRGHRVSRCGKPHERGEGGSPVGFQRHREPIGHQGAAAALHLR
jgi:hypothetical protein